MQTDLKYPRDYQLDEVLISGLSMKIPEGTFIPRPETEEWVAKVVNEYYKIFTTTPVVIDVCCGTGIIGLLIKKTIPNIHCISLDSSDSALKSAEENAKRNALSLDIRKSDLLSSIHPADLQYGYILLSNPPYVPDEDKNHIHENNLTYEPHNAIFGGGKDGLDVLRRMLQQLQTATPPILAVFELDPRNIHSAKKLSIENLQPKHTKILKDYNSLDRVLILEY